MAATRRIAAAGQINHHPCSPRQQWSKQDHFFKTKTNAKTDWVGVGVVVCLQRGADCLHMVQLMPLHPETQSSLASFKSRRVLPFWYRFIQVVMETRGR